MPPRLPSALAPSASNLLRKALRNMQQLHKEAAALAVKNAFNMGV